MICTYERSVWPGLVELISEFGGQKQDSELRASLKYIVRPCLRTKTKKQETIILEATQNRLIGSRQLR